jgi:hypothetical protein
MTKTRNRVTVTRTVLWMIGVGLLGACDSGTTAPTDAGRMDVADIGPSCTAPQSLCGNRCVDTQSDSANCGACGTACAAGQVCSAGSCQVRCPAGATVCNGTCVNLQTDNANCGACGNACAGGQMCSLGACSTTCASSLATCGGGDAGAPSFCADLANDRLNCGACGNACPAGNICVNRMCQVSCPMAQALCADICVDLQRNNAHCGSCGTACAAGTACTAGSCVLSCGAGITQCGSNCVNLQTDNNHCGACGTVCPAGQVCSEGRCGATCASPLITCTGTSGSYCANTAIDPANCGACSAACSLANVASSGCSGGTCSVVRCNPDFGDCDAMAANGCETDVRTSLQNCGGCGRACSLANATATCTAGACAVMACAAGYDDCDGNPANGCEVNTRTDNTNCGACGTTCGAGQVCSAGRCGATCSAPLVACTGTGGSFCANTAIDPANCGACGAACALTNVASQGCSGGVCSVGQCSPNFGDCDAMATNGCETDVRTSLQNCGGCGRACNLANATATCTAGACAVTACAAGFADCDGNPANGCEVNTRTDNTNCGACGTVCAAGQVCGMGSCATTCAAPLVLCGGACTNTGNDPAHCGACGNVCPSASNTIAVCAASNCAALCATGFGNCDNNLSNGCEANLTNSVTNCGACGTVCPTRANATSSCTGGTCGFTCSTGFADCDGNPANGCEVNLTTDRDHCGTCGTVCPALPGATPSCSASTCRSTCNTGFGDCDNNPVQRVFEPPGRQRQLRRLWHRLRDWSGVLQRVVQPGELPRDQAGQPVCAQRRVLH